MGIYIGGSTPQNGPIPQFRPDPWEGLRQVTVDPWDQMRQAAPQPQQAAVPGLLSRLTSPDNRDAMLGLAAGLLDAGRWSTTPVSWGEALGAGVKGYAAGKLTAEQRKQIEREQKRRDDEAAREAKRLEAYQQLVSGGVEGLTDTQRALLASMTPEQGAQMLMAQTMRQGAAENPNYINIEVSPGGRIVTLDSNDPAQNAEAKKLFAAGGKQVGLGAGKDSAAEDRIARLMTLPGMTKEQAIKIADNVIVPIKDPVSGQTYLADLSKDGMPQYQGPYPDNRDPTTVQPLQPTAPTGAPRPVTPPSPDPKGVPEGFNPESATGLPGAVSGVLNTVTGALNLPPYSRENMDAATYMDKLQATTVATLMKALPGRDTNKMMSLVERLTVSPNSIMTGAPQALTTYGQVRDMIYDEMQRLEKAILSNDGQWGPQALQDARTNYSELQQLYKNYSSVIDAFGKRGGSGGVDPAQFDE